MNLDGPKQLNRLRNRRVIYVLFTKVVELWSLWVGSSHFVQVFVVLSRLLSESAVVVTQKITESSANQEPNAK